MFVKIVILAFILPGVFQCFGFVFCTWIKVRQCSWRFFRLGKIQTGSRNSRLRQIPCLLGGRSKIDFPVPPGGHRYLWR